MRHSPAALLTRRLGALGALVLLGLLSACASTPMRPAQVMALGAQAPAPMGYLEFCARRPEQCGLAPSDPVAASPAQTDLRAQDLRRRYYWSIVSTGDANPSPRLTPASGEVGGQAGDFGRSPWSRPAQVIAPAAAPVLDRALWSSGPALPRQTALLLSSPSNAAASPPADPFAVIDVDARRPVQPIAVTAGTLAMLNSVNRSVNQAIRYAPAGALYGDDDYWTLPLDVGGLRAGDCKDYVLEKRKALTARGVPMADLSIAIVLPPTGGAHAVLLVATDHGELVLDSLSPWITPWSDLDYKWISRQAPGQQLVWVKIAPTGKG